MQGIFNSKMEIDARTQFVYDLYMNAPVAINTFKGKDLVVDFINPKMLELWGKSYEDVINKPLEIALPETKGQWFHETFLRIFNEGTEFTGKEVIADLHRRGKIERGYFNVIYRPMISNGAITGVVQVAVEVTELVEQRKKVEKSEELLKVALEAGKMGTWQVDFVNGGTVRSKLHDELFGYPDGTEEWTDQIFFNHVHPDFREYVKERFDENYKTGDLFFETKIIRKDGNIRWIQVKGKTTFGHDSTPLIMSGVIMDVTERREHAEKESQLVALNAAREEALRQGKELHDLFMNAPAMICTLNGPDHVFDLVNPQYQLLFPKRKLEGRPLMEALPELKGQPYKAILDEVYNTGKPFVGTEMPAMLDRFDTGVPEQAFISLVYQPKRDHMQNITGIVVFAYDITEQVRSRKLIEESEENLKLALKAGKMGTWNYYLKQQKLTRSDQYDTVFGYDERQPDWDYQKLLQHILPEDLERVKEGFTQLKEHGELNTEARIIGGDKKLKWIAFKGKAFPDADDLRMTGVVVDITAMKETEEKAQDLAKELAAANEELSASIEELTAANEEISATNEELAETNHKLFRINTDLDNFIYTASHDLKAPIANIEGLIRVLTKNFSKESSENEKVKKTLPLIYASIERFRKTINALTDIVKLQKEEQEEQLVNLKDLVDEVQMDMITTIEDSKASFNISIPEKTEINFSFKNIKSIVYNLISNAIKYRSPERNPVINISCKEEYGYLKLTVQDNGLGMDLKDESKIFSMFKRLHNHVEGSGIGLYIVKKILDNAGGRIEVSSKLNEGTTFEVFLKNN